MIMSGTGKAMLLKDRFELPVTCAAAAYGPSPMCIQANRSTRKTLSRGARSEVGPPRSNGKGSKSFCLSCLLCRPGKEKGWA